MNIACTALVYCLGAKVIVFAYHIAGLDGIQAKLEKAFHAVRVNGSTNTDKRKQAMDDFQQKLHVKSAILSIQNLLLALK